MRVFVRSQLLPSRRVNGTKQLDVEAPFLAGFGTMRETLATDFQLNLEYSWHLMLRSNSRNFSAWILALSLIQTLLRLNAVAPNILASLYLFYAYFIRRRDLLGLFFTNSDVVVWSGCDEAKLTNGESSISGLITPEEESTFLAPSWVISLCYSGSCQIFALPSGSK